MDFGIPATKQQNTSSHLGSSRWGGRWPIANPWATTQQFTCLTRDGKTMTFKNNMLVVTVVQDIKVILDHLWSCWIIFDHPKYEVDNNYSEQHPAVMATCLFHGGKLFIFFLVVCRCACSGRSGEKLWLLSLCVCLPCCCLPCYCLPCSSWLPMDQYPMV